MNWKRSRSGCRETIRRYLLVWLSVMEAWARVDVSMAKRRYIQEIFKRLNQQDGSDIDGGEEGARITTVILDVIFGEMMMPFADIQNTWTGTYFRGRAWVEIMNLHLDIVLCRISLSIQLEV